ncbi:CubicO group peptidase (beta-lactamase class C family) [Naumannella cuiyingiana]|uniref:CubicO group peptidase (Beta-lactamase class C family) n=1 Tax=Naumannella cuiyingiana TaxID=1347891 RepID=A0A7Z0IKW7_9ACTN|nr:serine hydrolase domain-containing protein [Naumannella cuiyingiana]NYI70953.1 CubicO group peptidase (beta-lactamase class C family) [Naumannella cuiyingiana]
MAGSATALAEQVLDEHGVDEHGPGAVVGGYVHGELIGVAARGLASVELGVPLDENSVFDIASVSKQFTVATLLRLGADLRTPVAAALGATGLDPGLTLGRCATHRAGIADYLDVLTAAGRGRAETAEMDAAVELALALAGVAVPGGQPHYSNSGYLLLAAAAERLGGDRLAALLQELIFDPLGMSHSVLRDRPGAVITNLVSSYAGTGGGELVRRDQDQAVVGDGAITTTLADLGRWLSFLDGGIGLGDGLRDVLVRRDRADGRALSTGAGIWHLDHLGDEVIGHSGSAYGFRSFLVLDRRSGVGVAVLANRADIAADAIAGRLLLGLTGGRPPARPTPRDPAARAVSGTWQSADGAVVTVGQSGLEVDGRARAARPVTQGVAAADGALLGVFAERGEVSLRNHLGARIPLAPAGDRRLNPPRHRQWRAPGWGVDIVLTAEGTDLVATVGRRTHRFAQRAPGSWVADGLRISADGSALRLSVDPGPGTTLVPA